MAGHLMKFRDAYSQTLWGRWLIPQMFEKIIQLAVPVWPGRSGAGWSALLRCYGSVTPREELVQTCDLMVGDLGKDPCEPGLGIDAVQFSSFDQGN